MQLNKKLKNGGYNFDTSLKILTPYIVFTLKILDFANASEIINEYKIKMKWIYVIIILK